VIQRGQAKLILDPFFDNSALGFSESFGVQREGASPGSARPTGTIVASPPSRTNRAEHVQNLSPYNFFTVAMDQVIKLAEAWQARRSPRTPTLTESRVFREAILCIKPCEVFAFVLNPICLLIGMVTAQPWRGRSRVGVAKPGISEHRAEDRSSLILSE
jgi:hypothetical protein